MGNNFITINYNPDKRIKQMMHQRSDNSRSIFLDYQILLFQLEQYIILTSNMTKRFTPLSLHVQVYLPYYYALGNIFSEQFLAYSVQEIEIHNICKLMLHRYREQKKEVVMVRCVNVKMCEFKLDFREEEGYHQKGFCLREICNFHTCLKRQDLTSNYGRCVLEARRNEIKELKPHILNILHERFPLYGHQSSKTIMAHLANRLGKYPNFIYRGLCKQLEKKVKKKFDNELAMIKRQALSLDDNYYQMVINQQSSHQQFDDKEARCRSIAFQRRN